MTDQPSEAARTRGPVEPDLTKEPRQISPFVTFDRGFATVDPADPNSVVFEDFSPRVLSADAPDEVYEEPEIPTVPKGSSAPEPASSSESTPTTEPQKSDNPVPPASTPAVETVSTPPLPASPTPLGPLPFPHTEDAGTDAGSPSPSESS